jgi:hypothetical protein
VLACLLLPAFFVVAAALALVVGDRRAVKDARRVLESAVGAGIWRRAVVASEQVVAYVPRMVVAMVRQLHHLFHSPVTAGVARVLRVLRQRAGPRSRRLHVFRHYLAAVVGRGSKEGDSACALRCSAVLTVISAA